MVAITTQPTALALPQPRSRVVASGGWPDGGPAALRLVPSGVGRPVAGPSWAATAVAIVLVVAGLLAVGFLVTADPTLTAGDAPVSMGEHVVVAGETMWSIARDVAPTGEAALYVERLVDANESATVEAGQVLQLPIP